MIVAQRRMPFLSSRQVAGSNAEGSLLLFTLFSSPDIDLEAEVTSKEDAALLDASLRSYWAFVGGFRVRELWFEWATAQAARFFADAGLRCVREEPAASATDAGAKVRLFCATREDAARHPGTHISVFLRARYPRLGLSAAEHELAEFALLDYPDAEIARLLRITEDGVKKRWRRVYQRVEAVEPDLLLQGGGLLRSQEVAARCAALTNGRDAPVSG